MRHFRAHFAAALAATGFLLASSSCYSNDDVSRFNQPDVVAEVQQAFEGYYASLRANDVPATQAWFRQSPLTVRFGNAENLFGAEEINAYRAASTSRATSGSNARERFVIATFGRDFATTSSMTRAENGKIGRATQVWARFPEGWKIVSAHVSSITDPNKR